MTWPDYVSKIFLLLGFVFVATTALANTQLEDVTVHSSTRAPAAEASFTIATSHISLADKRDQLISVAEVLAKVAGVHVTRFGGLGDFATVAIRGSTGEQVSIYWDGVPLNASAGGAVDLSQLPAALIESITVYRGYAPAQFDQSAIGGVIAITSRQSTPGHYMALTQSYGSLNTYEGSAIYSQQKAETDFLIAYQYQRSDGDFNFLDNNGTFANTRDDRIVPRQNNQFSKNSFLIRASRQEHENWQLSFSHYFFHETRGVPGLGTLTSQSADLSNLKNLTQLSVQWQARDHLTLRLTPFFHAEKAQFSDLNNDIGLSTQDNDDNTYHYGAQLAADWLIGTQHQVNTLLSYTGESFHPENFLATPRTTASSRRDRLAFSAGYDWALFHDRLIISPSARLESLWNRVLSADPSRALVGPNNQQQQWGLSGHLGLRWQVAPSWALLANGGRSFRAPNFIELFGDRGATLGNPQLKSEASWNFDAGFQWTPHFGKLTLNYFENHAQNLIQFLQTSQFTAQAQNLGSATLRGLEASSHWQALSWLNFDLNYTLQWAQDTSDRAGFDGKTLPGRPRHQIHAGAEVRYRWGTLFTDFDLIDGNFLDNFNALRVNHRSLLAIGLKLNPWKWGHLTLEGRNLLNQQVSDVAGFPVPGRLFFATLHLKHQKRPKNLRNIQQ